MEPRISYAVFMLLALIAFVAIRWRMPRPPELEAVPRRKRIWLPVAAFLGGALGGKLPFVGASSAGWLSPQAWLADGKTITMALVGAYLAVELAKLLLGIKAKTGDTFALPLAVALAIGRWGCFCFGCCYGTPTTLPWAVRFAQPDGSMVPCHPTQIYESFFHLFLAGLLLLMQRLDLLANQRLKFYLIAYASYRFLTEYIRPALVLGYGLTLYQWVCLAMIAGLTAQWWVDRDVQSNSALAAPS